MADKAWVDTITEAERLAAFAQTAAAVVDPELLHQSARAGNLDTLEEHLNVAANLSRALWLALAGVDDIDGRDKAGLYELASSVADHASAARYAFLLEGAIKADRAAKAAAEKEAAQ